MRHHQSLLLLVVAAVVTAPVAGAQEMPSFHAGEWGAQFAGTDGLSAGVLRFFSPRSALVMNVNASLQGQKSKQSGTSGASDMSNQYLTLALGLRQVRAFAPRTLAYTEWGGRIGGTHFTRTDRDAVGNPTRVTTASVDYGAYGALGGEYFVVSHVSLGASAALQGGRTASKVGGDGPRSSGHGWYLGTALRPITLTLYF